MKKEKEFIEEQMALTGQFQIDCHVMVDKAIETSRKCSYQDITNVWIFSKLAEFELRLREIENPQTKNNQ